MLQHNATQSAVRVSLNLFEVLMHHTPRQSPLMVISTALQLQHVANRSWRVCFNIGRRDSAKNHQKSPKIGGESGILTHSIVPSYFPGF